MALRMELSGFLISCATSAAKPLDGVHPPPQRGRRSRQRLAELADFVAPAQQRSRHRTGAAVALAHVARRVRQLQDRPREGQRQVPGQQHRQDQRAEEETEDGDAHGEQALVHLHRIARQQHDADRVAVALDRLGHRYQQLVVLRAADVGRHLVTVIAAGQPQFLPHVGLPVGTRGVRAELHMGGVRMRQQREHVVVQAPDQAHHGAARGGGRQRLGGDGTTGAHAHPAIGDQRAVRRVDLGAGVGRGVGQPPQQRAGDVGHQHGVVRIGYAHSALAQRAGIDARLFAQGGHLCFQQAVLVLVEIQHRAEQQGERHEVHQQHAPHQRRHPAGAVARRRR
jgi:hypothetical protein